VPKYCTRRKVLIPFSDDEDDGASSVQECGKNETAEQSEEDMYLIEPHSATQKFNKNGTLRSIKPKVVKVFGEDGQQYNKKIKMLFWHYNNYQRDNSGNVPNSSSPDRLRKHNSPQRSANSFSISPKKPSFG